MRKPAFSGETSRLADSVPGRVQDGPETRRRFPFSALTRRIIFFNTIALLVMTAGVVIVQSGRVGLIDERLDAIREQALIVASTLAEYTTDENTRSINLDEAEPLLRQLIEPTRLRARFYGRDGKLALDTRNLLARNLVEKRELPSLDRWEQIKGLWNRIYDGVMGVRPFEKLAPYIEAGNDGRAYREVLYAYSGDTAAAERVDEDNKLILSVAVPVQRFREIYGVLLVSSEGGDIDSILREERATLVEVFFVAFAVMVVLSFYLAGFVARPVRRLAAAADRVRRGRLGRESIPQMEDRHDEIADLANSLSGMTRALYDRIDAIERFAADVAHELKNPLTSLKSAVDMLTRTKDEAAREHMIEIVRDDVKRIDRLITDISDASRVDAEMSREHSEPVALVHLLETIVEVYRFSEEPTSAHIVLDLNLPRNAIVLGRDERLGQVFRNLIDNAVSFSPEGGTVKIIAVTEGKRARITVDDEGPGIPPDNLETIFERFYTERPPGHDFGTNSGLGLSIARQIVIGVGGSIYAENRQDPDGKIIGARFTVMLPIRNPR
ncbi:MAG TPA: stimulus-sensing domain-containing protein [Rhizomicrobium sp.]|nr:stimulus-sensing domain-containing protein [Rhizomicrobium sp.]